MTASRIAALCLGFCAAAAAAAGAQAAGSGYHVLDRVAGPDGGWDYIRVDTANNKVLLAHGGSVVSHWFATLQQAADPIYLGSSPALAGLLHQGLSRSSEASSPFCLANSSEFCSEQNSIERHLNAPVLGG